MSSVRVIFTTNQVQLINILHRNHIAVASESVEMMYKNNECALLLLYFDWCPHSIKIAPYYNAIGRAYPQLHVLAINSYNQNGLNIRLSLFGVPSIVLLHSDRIASRFNETDINLETLKAFITKTTSFEPLIPLEVTDEDYLGPVPTKIEPQFDYIMLACVIFLIFTFIYFTHNKLTTLYAYLLDYIRSTWLESQREIHEHMD